MLKPFLSLVIVLFSQRSYSQDITISANIKGVAPTASGQIGVNPVTDLGPERYHNIGPNTQWYQPDGSTTKWIGPNTQYLTDLPYTTTVNNQPSVTQAPAAVVAATAIANSEGIAAGDISIALSPKVIDVFNKLFDEAKAACSVQSRRDSCVINGRFAQRVAEEARQGGAFDFIGAESRALLPMIAASDVASIAGPALLASPLVGIAVTWTLLGKLQAWTISSSSIGGGKGNGDDDKCPADAPTGVDAPLCGDSECKGNGASPNQKCKEGKYRGCNCLLEMDIEDVVETDGTKYDDNMTFLELQQKILTDFINENSKPPFCNHAASPRGERVPKEYCNCGDENRKTLTYSVATSTASPYEACPYTTNNGPTVTFQDTTVPKATPVIRCATPQERSFKSLDGYEYINTFCNTRNGQKLNIRDTRLNLYDSVSMFFNENKDPYVRIYAYVDDTCRDKGEIKLNSEDCGRALDSIMHQCDKDTEEKKMGGSAMVNCQWYDIVALKYKGNPTCNGIPSEHGC